MEVKFMKKKWIAALLSMSMVASLLAGCGKPETQTTSEPTTEESTEKEPVEPGAAGDTAKEDLKGTLVFAIWDNISLQLYEEMDLEGRFQKLYPNANIEIEKLKDDSEYWNTMKIRASADQLPDIMYNKTFTLSRFQDYLLDLRDTEAAKGNSIATGYGVNGKVLGVPEKKTQEYVYYWKDMFKEAEVEVPTTWQQLQDVSTKLQEFYGVSNKNFAAIGMGGKDEWPTYPFTEYMPALESGNGQNWNTMAAQDNAFAEGTDIYKAYQKMESLFQSGVFGKDPLGIGHDQAISLFAQKQSAMIACGGWGYDSIKDGADSTDELGTFYLPTRNSEEEPFRTTTQGDSFMSITTSSKNPELAKAFVEFYFSDAWYPEFIQAISDDTTMTAVPKEKPPVLAEADALQPGAELVMYDGGGDDFTALQAETAFDYKKLGAQALVKDFDLNGALEDLNQRWNEARKNQNIK